MARAKKTPTPPAAADAFEVSDSKPQAEDSGPKTRDSGPATPAPDANGFDVPTAPSNPPAPPPVEDDKDEEDAEPETKPAPEQTVETPDQRRLMRQKRIAKAEEEQLRRLTRQFPVVARLVQEIAALRKQLAQRK